MQQLEQRDVTGSQSQRARESVLLRSCFWCERLHPGEHPLSVCPTCAARFSIMRSLGMSGSYPLNDEAIDEVLRQTSPGNYALGYMEGDAFQVFYVGRSDSDVRQCLHDWVDRPSRYKNYASPALAPWGVHHRGQLPVDSPSPARVGSGESSYTRFAYSYAPSAQVAFEQECRTYEVFGGSEWLDNEAPPVWVARSSNESPAYPC